MGLQSEVQRLVIVVWCHLVKYKLITMHQSQGVCNTYPPTGLSPVLAVVVGVTVWITEC